MTDTALPISDPDHMWAVEQVDQWAHHVDHAVNTAQELVANWDEGKQVSRFWPGKTLSEAVRERHPHLSARWTQMVISVGTVRHELPEETKGMTDGAVRAVGSISRTNTVRSVDGKTKGKARNGIDQTKKAKAKQVLDEAKQRSNGKPPTAKQVKAAKTEVEGKSKPEATCIARLKGQGIACGAPAIDGTDYCGRHQNMAISARIDREEAERTGQCLRQIEDTYTRGGYRPCTNKAKPGSTYCGVHQPKPTTDIEVEAKEMYRQQVARFSDLIGTYPVPDKEPRRTNMLADLYAICRRAGDLLKGTEFEVNIVPVGTDATRQQPDEAA